jgi:hypothetical protein
MCLSLNKKEIESEREEFYSMNSFYFLDVIAHQLTDLRMCAFREGQASS